LKLELEFFNFKIQASRLSFKPIVNSLYVIKPRFVLPFTIKREMHGTDHLLSIIILNGPNHVILCQYPNPSFLHNVLKILASAKCNVLSTNYQIAYQNIRIHHVFYLYRMKFFASKMMTTNLKYLSIPMGSNLKICKSKSKTTLSAFKENMKKKQMKATAKAMFLDI